MAAERPNIVYIFPDEHRQAAMGCMNADPVVTPNLDRLASEGLVLTHAVSNCPICSPYRAMLFSGRYPHSNGVISNCHSDTAPLGIFLRETEVCLSDVLHGAGYSQGYIGKLHLDAPLVENAPHTEGRRGDGRIWDAYTPPGPRRHGFDFWHSYGCCDWHLRPHYWEGDAPVTGRIDVDDWSPRHETDVAIDFIRNTGGEYRDPGKPFSLFVAFNPPHMPFREHPSEYMEPYAVKAPEDLLVRPNVGREGPGGRAWEMVAHYFAMVTGVDEQVGRIMRCLDDVGLAGDTIVVFTSDHGDMMGSHGLMGKSQPYDEAFLVPFIIRAPGRIKPGTDDLLLSAPDIMPTLLGLAGLAGLTPQAVEGRDLSAALLGGRVDRPTSALYLNMPPDRPAAGRRGVRTHRYTYVVDRGDGDGGDGERERAVLYDSEADPFQMEDVADANPAVAEELRSELTRWLEYTGDPWLG